MLYPKWLESALSALADVIEPIVAWISGGRRLVVVESVEDGLAFHKVSRRRTTMLGTDSAPGELMKKLKVTKYADVELRLDPGKVTFAHFKIPAASAGLAAQIVESRLDRLTPWRTDAILHGFALSPKPGPDGQVEINVAATSRHIATASLDRLAAFGLVPSALGATSEPIKQRLPIDLFAGRNDPARRARRKSIGTVALVFVALCVFACGTSFYVLYQSNQRISELEATSAKARNRLVQASGSSADRDRDFAFIGMKTREESRFHLIDRLAAILPDNTYLDELTIDPEEIRLAGSSAEASNLIKLLEDDPAFVQAKFAAPVTRQEDGRDRFEITVARATKAKEVAP